MSDLFCEATVIVARHGEAEYESRTVSDDGGSLTLAGRDEARAMAATLQDRRIAAVWCSDMSRAVQTAEIVAAELGVPVRVRKGLREFGVGSLAGQPYDADVFAEVFGAWTSGDLSDGCPGAETGSEVVTRVTDELNGVVDLYRGETVLVISHGGVMSLVLPRLARNVKDDFGAGKPPANAGCCELAADADGWVLRTWNSQTLGEYGGA